MVQIFFGIALITVLVINCAMSKPCQHCGWSEGQRDYYHPDFKKCIKCGKKWLFEDLWKCGSCGHKIDYYSAQPDFCPRCEKRDTMLRSLGPDFKLCSLLGSIAGGVSVFFAMSNPSPGYQVDNLSGLIGSFAGPFILVFFIGIFLFDRYESKFKRY